MNNNGTLGRKGINYDVGTHTRGKGPTSRDDFDPEIVRKEMAIIRSELHCNAVRISGQDVARLTLAAEAAIEQGLEVWLSPSLVDADERRTLAYLIECAQAAERLRQCSPDVVFVAGCELSFFMSGLIAGATSFDRMRTMMNPLRLIASTIRRGSFHRKLNAFLAEAAREIRKQFHGQVTYASGPWENVDWTLFDFVSIDYYRDAMNRRTYREKLNAYFRHGKPVVVTEFGCCTYEGAEAKGGYGWAIVDRSVAPHRLKGDYKRDEEGQARCLSELLEVFREAGVSGAFCFTFVMPSYPYSDDPRFDLDAASYGVVRSLATGAGTAFAGMPWEPKRAFGVLADYYDRH